MSRHQNSCQHCGEPAAEKTAGQQVYIECTNLTGYKKEDGTEVPPCGMRTPQLSASPDYGAWDRVMAIWNRSEADQKGSKSDPYDVPQAVYYQGMYYREDDGKLYLCFKQYKGTRLPSELINHNFALVVEG